MKMRSNSKTNFVTNILELLDIEELFTEYCFRKLKFTTIYNTYSNKSPFKYYLSILGGGMGGGFGGHAYLLFLGVGVPEFGKTYLYNT